MQNKSSTHDYKHGTAPYRGTNKRKPVDRGRGFKRVGDYVEVYDIDLAAWLHMNNVPIANAYKREKRETVITFLDPKTDDKIAQLSVGWLNSESAKFAGAVRQIKKICFSTYNQRGSR
jgi:hypothetical protein